MATVTQDIHWAIIQDNKVLATFKDKADADVAVTSFDSATIERLKIQITRVK